MGFVNFNRYSRIPVWRSSYIENQTNYHQSINPSFNLTSHSIQIREAYFDHLFVDSISILSSPLMRAFHSIIMKSIFRKLVESATLKLTKRGSYEDQLQQQQHELPKQYRSKGVIDFDLDSLEDQDDCKRSFFQCFLEKLQLKINLKRILNETTTFIDSKSNRISSILKLKSIQLILRDQFSSHSRSNACSQHESTIPSVASSKSNQFNSKYEPCLRKVQNLQRTYPSNKSTSTTDLDPVQTESLHPLAQLNRPTNNETEPELRQPPEPNSKQSNANAKKIEPTKSCQQRGCLPKLHHSNNRNQKKTKEKYVMKLRSAVEAAEQDFISDSPESMTVSLGLLDPDIILSREPSYFRQPFQSHRNDNPRAIRSFQDTVLHASVEEVSEEQLDFSFERIDQESEEGNNQSNESINKAELHYESSEQVSSSNEESLSQQQICFRQDEVVHSQKQERGGTRNRNESKSSQSFRSKSSLQDSVRLDANCKQVESSSSSATPEQDLQRDHLDSQEIRLVPQIECQSGGQVNQLSHHYSDDDEAGEKKDDHLCLPTFFTLNNLESTSLQQQQQPPQDQQQQQYEEDDDEQQAAQESMISPNPKRGQIKSEQDTPFSKRSRKCSINMSHSSSGTILPSPMRESPHPQILSVHEALSQPLPVEQQSNCGQFENPFSNLSNSFSNECNPFQKNSGQNTMSLFDFLKSKAPSQFTFNTPRTSLTTTTTTTTPSQTNSTISLFHRENNPQDSLFTYNSHSTLFTQQQSSTLHSMMSRNGTSPESCMTIESLYPIPMGYQTNPIQTSVQFQTTNHNQPNVYANSTSVNRFGSTHNSSSLSGQYQHDQQSIHYDQFGETRTYNQQIGFNTPSFQGQYSQQKGGSSSLFIAGRTPSTSPLTASSVSSSQQSSSFSKRINAAPQRKRI